jgi:hypothetical protein
MPKHLRFKESKGPKTEHVEQNVQKGIMSKSTGYNPPELLFYHYTLIIEGNGLYIDTKLIETDP